VNASDINKAFDKEYESSRADLAKYRTDESAIEFERMKTARDSLLIKNARLTVENHEMKERWDGHYEAGWNSALEMAAHSLETEFSKAFGKDTLKSVAIYIKGFKK
jgi:regulator of replication initiation timing